MVTRGGGLALGDRGWVVWLVVLGLLGAALIVLATLALFFLRLHYFPHGP
jgi:hypothetical protein